MKKRKFKTPAQKARIHRRALKRWKARRIEGGHLIDGTGTIRERLLILGYKNYATYLASIHWKELRTRLMPYGTFCIACEVREAENLHHKTYARLGAENDDDLVPLCRGCHDRTHRSERMGGKGGLEGALKRIIKHNKRRERKCFEKLKSSQN